MSIPTYPKELILKIFNITAVYIFLPLSIRKKKTEYLARNTHFVEKAYKLIELTIDKQNPKPKTITNPQKHYIVYYYISIISM